MPDNLVYLALYNTINNCAFTYLQNQSFRSLMTVTQYTPTLSSPCLFGLVMLSAPSIRLTFFGHQDQCPRIPLEDACRDCVKLDTVKPSLCRHVYGSGF